MLTTVQPQRVPWHEEEEVSIASLRLVRWHEFPRCRRIAPGDLHCVLPMGILRKR